MGIYDKKSVVLREIRHEQRMLKMLDVRGIVIKEHEVTWVHCIK